MVNDSKHDYTGLTSQLRSVDTQGWYIETSSFDQEASFLRGDGDFETGANQQQLAVERGHILPGSLSELESSSRAHSSTRVDISQLQSSDVFESQTLFPTEQTVAPRPHQVDANYFGTQPSGIPTGSELSASDYTSQRNMHGRSSSVFYAPSFTEYETNLEDPTSHASIALSGSFVSGHLTMSPVEIQPPSFPEAVSRTSPAFQPQDLFGARERLASASSQNRVRLGTSNVGLRVITNPDLGQPNIGSCPDPHNASDTYSDLPKLNTQTPSAHSNIGVSAVTNSSGPSNSLDYLLDSSSSSILTGLSGHCKQSLRSPDTVATEYIADQNIDVEILASDTSWMQRLHYDSDNRPNDEEYLEYMVTRSPAPYSVSNTTTLGFMRNTVDDRSQ